MAEMATLKELKSTKVNLDHLQDVTMTRSPQHRKR